MLTAEHMEALIRRYFDGCNDADVAAMVACFTPDAVHYFPPGMYGGAWRGADTIAANWAHRVATLGSAWTVDRVLTDPSSAQAVIEWTHFKTVSGTILRGDEWYVFDRDSGRISEIRAYYASPAEPSYPELALGGFDYAGRGYPSPARCRARTRRSSGPDAGQVCGWNRRRRRLLPTTKMLDSPIAAPAIMGLSSPETASGRAATL